MKIGELAQRTGLTAHTLRYYERVGLLPYAARNSAQQRDYDAAILPWIAFLGRLKTTGMPIREMRRYAELRELGAASAAARCDLLQQHRERVRVHLAELQSCLLALDDKIAGYAGVTPSAPRTPKTRIRHVDDAPQPAVSHPTPALAGQPARALSARPARARGNRR